MGSTSIPWPKSSSEGAASAAGSSRRVLRRRGRLAGVSRSDGSSVRRSCSSVSVATEASGAASASARLRRRTGRRVAVLRVSEDSVESRGRSEAMRSTSEKQKMATDKGREGPESVLHGENGERRWQQRAIETPVVRKADKILTRFPVRSGKRQRSRTCGWLAEVESATVTRATTECHPSRGPPTQLIRRRPRKLRKRGGGQQNPSEARKPLPNDRPAQEKPRELIPDAGKAGRQTGRSVARGRLLIAPSLPGQRVQATSREQPLATLS